MNNVQDLLSAEAPGSSPTPERPFPEGLEGRPQRLGRGPDLVLLVLCTWGRRHAVALDEVDRAPRVPRQDGAPAGVPAPLAGS